MATLRLVRAAERAGVERFVFFSAMNAHHHSRTRFFRAKALAEEAVEESSLSSLIFRPSIIYTPGDPWLTLLDRLSRLPAVPVSGSGKARFQPVWAEDVAEAVMNCPVRRQLDLRAGRPGGAVLQRHRPRAVLRASEQAAEAACTCRCRSCGLRCKLLRFATWEEAELMEEPMVTERGTADIEQLGVSPHSMPAVLGR